MLDYMNEWLKDYSYIINAILTLATIIYVIITGWILVTQKKLNAQNILPHLVLTKEIKVDKIVFDEMINYFKIEIKNIGRGPALNLKVINFPNELSFSISNNYLTINEVGSVNFSLSSTDSKFEQFYSKGRLNYSKIDFTIIYEDMNKNYYYTKFFGKTLET